MRSVIGCPSICVLITNIYPKNPINLAPLRYIKIFYISILVLSICSCYENLEPDIPSQEETTIEEINQPQQDVPANHTKDQLLDQQQPADDSAVFSSLLADMFKALSLAQSVNAREEAIAQTRNNCPLTYLVTDGIYPDTFYVDFDNCDPSAVFNQKYDGALVFIINGALDDEEVCPLFSVRSGAGNEQFFVAPGPTADNNKNILIENDIDFCLIDNNGDDLSYSYYVNDNIYVNNIVNSAYTKYPDGMSGGITIKSIANDDLGNAATLIDNTFLVSAAPTIIECIHSNGDIESFCIATNPEGLKFRLICGCPETGQIYIQSNIDLCGNQMSKDNYWDFSYTEPGSNSCENTALNADDEVVVIPCGQSF